MHKIKTSSHNKKSLAVLTSHPIQYQAPLFQKLTELPTIDLIVYFRSKPSKFNKEFNRNVEWDIPLLDGYNHHFIKGIFWFLSDLKKQRPYALIVFGWNSLTSWLAIFGANIFGIPVLLHGENPLNQELLKPRWKRFIKKIVLGGLLFNMADSFLYIGDENKKLYRHYGVSGEKLFFTPYAVDNSRFMAVSKLPMANRQSLREKLGIREKDVAILFVGKLIEKKRPFDLLKTHEMLANRQLQIANCLHLIFVGDGKLRPELEKYSKEHKLKNIHFVGFKNQTELPEYYTLADIFVLPSGLGETWGLVVNEAMNFGLPVVVSDVVGCGPDLTRENKNGFIVPLGDIESLAQKINFLVINRNRREQFGNQSRKIIEAYSYTEDISGILSALSFVNKPHK